MRKKWMHSLFQRRILVSCLLVVQLVLIVYLAVNSGRQSRLFSQILSGMSFVAATLILNKREKSAYKMSWLVLVLVFPIFGGLFYLLFTCQSSTRRFRKKTVESGEKLRPLFLREGSSLPEALAQAPECAPQLRYLQQYAGFPVYRATRTEYLTPGECKFERMKEILCRAQHYIFLEYFIIRAGRMWDEIFEILRERAAAGIEVRVMYDDFGCFRLLPADFDHSLREAGITFAVFNPFRPALSTDQNNRDHRKVVVVDGQVAITGGINIGDEYINAYERYGHWKDAAILIEGRAAWSMTLMFLEMWSLCTDLREDFEKYYPRPLTRVIPDDGLVLPYADSPMDNENVGEHVYMQIIQNAKDYVYINTPYLIIGDGMVSALKLAAKSGVDVRIVTPHRPDKWLVHAATRSYYRELVNAGVKIFEYSKGFIHSKTFVADDRIATVGTTNLDFRSLYLHFECGVWLYRCSAVLAIKQDYLETLQVCQPIGPAECENRPPMRFLQELLRVFAPLL